MVTSGRDLDQSDWRAFAHGVATQVSHVLALARAYADREVAERRATAHAALLDALIENAPDEVFHLDLDGNVLFSNRTGQPDDVIGTPGRNTELRRALSKLIETGEPQGFEATGYRNGAQVWYSMRLGPIKEQGRVVGAVLVARDV